MTKLYLNITTEDGELLERVEVPVTDDSLYPIGRGVQRAAVLLDIEIAARVVQARAAQPQAATGHVIGATYRSAYWGGTYKVVGIDRNAVIVECVTPGGGAHQTPGERWSHCTQLSPKDERLS